MRDTVGSSVSATHRLSMLNPRPLNRPATRASTPNSFSTSTESVCCCLVKSVTEALTRGGLRRLRRCRAMPGENRHHAILAGELELLNALLFELLFRAQIVLVVQRIELLLQIKMLHVEVLQLGNLVDQRKNCVHFS